MLTIQDNINKIIKTKGLTKKEFANKLIDLKPTVSRTGEVPSVSAIYSYLNGRINIPIELISYVAEILNVTEQELFDTSAKTRTKCFKYFLQNATKEDLEYFNNLINAQIYSSELYPKEILINSKNKDEKIELFIDLLKYAPFDFIDKIIDKLKEYEKLGKSTI